MEALDQTSLAVGLATIGAFALAAFFLPQLHRRIFRYSRAGAEVLASRRERLGLIAAPEAPAPAGIPVFAERTAATMRVAPLTEGDGPDVFAPRVDDVLSVAVLCGRDDLDVKKILAQLADLLPSALQPSAQLSCRIELMESIWWSAGYVTPPDEFRVPLKVGESEVGSIIVGYAQAKESPSFDAGREAFVNAAAALANQMLERRADQVQLDRLRTELRRRQIMLAQTQRFAKVGYWEYETATGEFTWSDEVRQMAGMDAEGKAGREAEKLIAKRMQEAVDEVMRTHRPLVCEFTVTLAGSELRWLHATGDVQLENAAPTQILGIVRDVSEEKETHHRLVHSANHDVLTGLPNRRFFQERIEATLADRSAPGALLLLDIDGFKHLNDTGGHDVGDMLLRDFARRLYEAATSQFVARLGGDEFAVILSGVDKMRAEYLARALLAAISGPVLVFGRAIRVHVSAGLALFPVDGRNAAELMKSADLALYEAKARGRDLLVNYAPEFRAALDRREAICSEVRDALPENQFLPYYQPKIRLEDGRIAGFEALLRWNHPAGLRTPGSMLPALDDPELSRALCRAMLDRIITDVARWQAKGLSFGRIAFNASSSEFGEFDIADHLLRRLRTMGIKTSNFGLEVTETVFLNGAAESIRATLAKLRNAGIEIALDDFGTGFASLTHLQEFPVDVIKIDQSFIRGLVTDAGSRAITSAVLSLGRSLGKTVVAEGVETAEQARLLKVGGCEEVQGFYFARPMPGDDVPTFLENWRGIEEIGALEQAA